ncbi:NAD(P)/FAD-dependent oxidoreductase [Paraburkholderia sp.]|uniref:NAD(P)/FAD-dependent oxidoreductase n=1 Tax=Paraburkholderia sp. TaxID=1926495 RepID=UPI0039E38179
MRNVDADTVVIGGGVVGMSIAYGLVKARDKVIVLDEGDDAFRAARGNFGLVWVQGKGAGHLDYARWSLASARRWKAFAQELKELTRIDVELQQAGGLRPAFAEDSLARQLGEMARIRDAIGCAYPYQALDAADVRKLIPEAGADMVGAIYSPMDGHVSPLKLLRALVQAFSRSGGALCTSAAVQRITPRAGGFEVSTAKHTLYAGRVVLAAGLGCRALAPQVGLDAPVHPERGQVLVTERMQRFLPYPTPHVRQTGEGVIQLGDSKEDVGFDDGTTTSELGRIARHAIRYFPLLDRVNVVRAWGALRVMTPDGYPIYEASTECPGAFLVTCHSGITLAANHAGAIADWIRGASEPVDINRFKASRFHGFHVQTATH